jgi:hypothetical protein
MLVAALVAGCSSNEEPKEEEPPMKVEDTVFGDLIGTQDKARVRSIGAVELHRDALEKRLDADEGAAPDEDTPPEE